MPEPGSPPPVPPAAEIGQHAPPPAPGHNVVRSAKLIAVCTLLSRVTGLVRDMFLASAFGLAWIQDAWVYAFQIPNLFRRLFGEGAMAAAFVPTFTRVLEQDGRAAAWKLFARTLALLTVAVSTVILLIGMVLGLIALFHGGPPEATAARQLLLALTAVMLPFMLTICVLALFSSMLNCLGSFVPAALAPVVLNLAMIGAIRFAAPTWFPGRPEAQVYIVAVTVVAAGVLQLLLLWLVLRQHGIPLGWELHWSDPAVRRMLGLVGPVLLGQGVLAFGVYLDAQVCILLTQRAGGPAVGSWFGLAFEYPLREGALSAVTYAQRLYQFPLGVLVISLATAALPAFSRLATHAQWPAWTGEVRQALRLAIFEGLLAGIMMVVLSVQLVRLLFEYGRFGPADSLRAGQIVAIYGLGLWAFCAQHIVIRAFYSLQDVRTPLWISIGLLPLNMGLNLMLIFVPRIREQAFAYSTCLTAMLLVVIGLFLLHRRTGVRILNGCTLRGMLAMVVAALGAAATVLALQPPWEGITNRIPSVVAGRAFNVFGLLTVGTLVYLLLGALLRLPEVRLLLPRRKR